MQDTPQLTHRHILRIAIPVMLSNVSTPLIGIVDTGVVGQIPDPSLIGAVAMGSVIFSLLFWAFGFLRMGTTGLTAQALGAGDTAELSAGLERALTVAAIAGVTLIALQWPIREIAFWLVEGSPQVEAAARDYFNIRIWAAPATLANYAVLGWLIGLGRTDIGLGLQLLLNLTNVVLDAVLVTWAGWGVTGVAAGTLTAEYVAATAGLWIAATQLAKLGGVWRWRDVISLSNRSAASRSATATNGWKRTLSVNTDIMIRTLSLIFVFVWFMAQGASQGDVVLAANAVLMQFVSTSAYFLDGLAFAAETLVGQALGARNRDRLSTAFRLTTIWAGAIALVLSLILWIGGPTFIDLLSVDPSVRATAREFMAWAVWAPVVGVWAFQLDGTFIGATFSSQMRNAMLLSTAIFLAAWWLLMPWGNLGLWAAFYVHYAARTVTLGYYFQGLLAMQSKAHNW